MTPDRRPTSEEGEDDRLDALEARVRKVQHLDPFSLVAWPDGRFRAELQRAVDDLEPRTARRILRELEPVLERLRERAGEG